MEVWKGAILAQNSGCEETFKAYLYALEEFCKFCDTTPEEILREYEAVVSYGDERRFARKWEMKIKQYTAWLSTLVWNAEEKEWIQSVRDTSKPRMAPSTLRGRLRVLSSFAKHFDLPLKIMKPKRTYNIYSNQPIKPEQIQAIVKVSLPRDRALFLFMKDSGLRPSTIVQLPYSSIKSDFEIGRIPCKVIVEAKYTKGKYHSYFSFIGEEAVKALKEYFAIRGTPKDAKPIFKSLRANNPATVWQITKQFRKAVLQLGLLTEEERHERRGKPQTIRLYTLRKFFRNRAMPMGVEYVQFLMGHHLPMQDSSYFEPDEKEMRKAYMRVYPRLAVMELDRDERMVSMERRIIELERLVRQFREELEKR